MQKNLHNTVLKTQIKKTKITQQDFPQKQTSDRQRRDAATDNEVTRSDRDRIKTTTLLEFRSPCLYIRMFVRASLETSAFIRHNSLRHPGTADRLKFALMYRLRVRELNYYDQDISLTRAPTLSP